MPREEFFPSKYFPVSSQSKSYVMLIQNEMLQNNEENKTPDIVKLKHPRTGIGAMFLFSPDNSVIQEIFCFSDKRSWFVNDTVIEDGKVFLSTPIDPLFLLLPILKKTKTEGKVMPLQDLLFDQNYPETQRLLKAVFKSVHLIGERKGPEALNAWMYVEDKTMKWLIKKTEKVAKVLKEKQINLSGSATSKNFVKSVKEDALNDESVYLRTAHELVSEYLTNDLSLNLLSRLGLEIDQKPKNKRKFSKNEENEISKKVKVKEEEVGDVPKQDKTKALDAKEKAMKKAASGSKSITSFFKKSGWKP